MYMQYLCSFMLSHAIEFTSSTRHFARCEHFSIRNLDQVMLLTRQKFVSECDITLKRYCIFSKHKDNKYWYTIFQYQECAQYDICIVQ